MLFLDKKFLVFFVIILFFNVSFSDEFRDIEINGTNRINSKYLYNELNLGKIKGLEEKTKIIESKIKDCDFIENYNIVKNNNKITINVVEKRFIKKINFNGNKKLKEDNIKSIISTTDNSFFDENKINEDIEKLTRAYESLGLLSVDISYSISEIDEKNIDVDLHIDEHVKTKIGKIYFVGNRNFSKRILYKKIFSKENRVLQFGAKKDFSAEKIEYDKYLLSNFYRNNGYLDFDVKSEYKLSKDGKFAYIKYEIYEGTKYKINDILIRNEVPSFNEKLVLDNIKIKRGDFVNLELLEKRINFVNNVLNKNNFGFISIIPDISKADNNSVNFILYIKNSQKTYINKINVRGNYKTYEYVIRDTISLSEGQLINEDLINEAKQNLVSLGFLKNIDIKKSPTNEQDKIDLDVEFEESNTGTIGMGFGYSTLDKFNVNFNFGKTNLFGRLMSFDANAIVSKYRNSYGMGFGKPHIFNTKMFGGFDAFYDKNNYSEYENLDYNEKSYGLSFYTRYRLSSTISQKFYYSFIHKLNFNISNNYRDVLDNNDSNTSLVGTTLYYDTRDDLMYPLNGNYAYIDLGVAGIGGNKKYIKTVADFSNYQQLYKQLVFRTQLGGGYIRSFTGKDLYPDDGFYVGGSKLRGFNFGSAGLKIKSLIDNSDSSAGGTKYFVFNTELRLPIVDGDVTKIYGMLFYNAGLATGIEKNKNVNLNKILNSRKIRSAYGLAIIFKTPAGNIGLEFSNPISKEKYDNVENFRLNLGTDF